MSQLECSSQNSAAPDAGASGAACLWRELSIMREASSNVKTFLKELAQEVSGTCKVSPTLWPAAAAQPAPR